MKKLSLNAFMSDNRVLRVISFLAAIVIWFIVSIVIEPEDSITVNEVPVIINEQSSIIVKQGLKAVSLSESEVSVVVSGKKYILGNIDKDDIEIMVDLTPVSGPGDYALRLSAYEAGNDNQLVIVSVKPDIINVKFDRQVGYAFPIELNLSGVEMSESFLMEEATMSKTIVTVTGAEDDIKKIAKAEVRVELNHTLEKTETVSAPVEFFNSAGAKIDTSLLLPDVTTVDVTIPVLQLKELDVTFSYTNIPENFPVKNLEYSLSVEKVLVAGPTYVVGSYSEINIGYVDIKTITTGATYVFDLKMPTGFESVDSISKVTLTFNTEGMETRSFNVTNINVLNQPEEYEVTLNAKQISDVVFVGSPQIFENMTTGDIVAEIDLSEFELAPGQYKRPARISAPNKGLVWAYGDYYIVVNIKAK